MGAMSEQWGGLILSERDHKSVRSAAAAFGTSDRFSSLYFLRRRARSAAISSFLSLVLGFKERQSISY